MWLCDRFCILSWIFQFIKTNRLQIYASFWSNLGPLKNDVSCSCFIKWKLMILIIHLNFFSSLTAVEWKNNFRQFPKPIKCSKAIRKIVEMKLSVCNSVDWITIKNAWHWWKPSRSINCTLRRFHSDCLAFLFIENSPGEL